MAGLLRPMAQYAQSPTAQWLSYSVSEPVQVYRSCILHHALLCELLHQWMQGTSPVQGKRNAASRLGQALGQLARASMHLSEGEGPIPLLSRRATQRKRQKADDAVSADEGSSPASGASMTEQRHLKVSHIFPCPCIFPCLR